MKLRVQRYPEYRHPSGNDVLNDSYDPGTVLRMAVTGESGTWLLLRIRLRTAVVNASTSTAVGRQSSRRTCALSTV
ncbi:hypothetical protein [Enterobacter phage 03_vB_Eclo_IJM]|nr:hypothetical protein [Enterobacter phage 03_vB_Eclo_IJM]